MSVFCGFIFLIIFIQYVRFTFKFELSSNSSNLLLNNILNLEVKIQETVSINY